MVNKSVSKPSAGALSIAVVLLLLITPGEASWIDINSYKTGAVYTREIVRDESGNAIYVEYGADGKEVLGGLVLPDLPENNYQVLSADRYRSFVAMYRDVVDSYTDHGNPPPVLVDSQTYSDPVTAFYTLSGDLIYKPTLRNDTVTVVLAPEEMRYTPDGKLVLMELPIDPTINPDSASYSLLINRDDGAIVYETANNIGYRVGFYGDGANVEDAFARKPSHQIYGPLARVPVEMVSFNSPPVYTTDEGKYTLPYRIPPCPGFSYEMNSLTAVKLHYKRFNPQGGSTRPYYLFNWGTESCYGYFDVTPLGATLSTLSAVSGAFSTTSKVDFPIDIMVLSGRAALVNSVTTGFSSDGAVPLLADTRFDATREVLERVAQEKYDLDADGVSDTSVLGRVVTGDSGSAFYKSAEGETPEVQGVWLSSKGGAPTFDDANLASSMPHLTRLPDWSADFSDHALLSSISERDLADTDIYVFRESDGSLIMERKGLGLDGNAQLIGVDNETGQFAYTLRIVGGRGRLSSGAVGDVEDAEFRQWQVGEGVVSSSSTLYQRAADHLRPGEVVRIIAINRASGYLGAMTETLEASSAGGGDLDIAFDVRDIQMMPPNIKVWAERKRKSQLDMSDEAIQQNLIGNEGAGMSNDDFIVIYTEWLDQDGDPLPSELGEYGFTGRLARVNYQGEIVDVGNASSESADNVNNFSVKPGLQLQLMRLPEQVASQQHYFVQINGQPQSRNPSFENVGANGGVLDKRPNKFVPVKTPIYDEVMSNQLRHAAASGGVYEPQLFYQWVYRPDYHFSVYELMVWEKIRTDMWQQPHSLTDAESPTLQNSDVMFGMLYDLNRSDNPLPEAYSYDGERELIFSLGEQEVSASLGYGQTVEFEDPTSIGELTPEDHLTIRLYTNNDAGNILWQYEMAASSVVLHSIAQGDPATGKRRTISMLDDSYFFTSLGHKKAFIYKAGFGANDKVKVLGVEGGKFDTFPAANVDVSFNNGYAMFLLLNKKDGAYVTPDSAAPNKAYKITFLITPDQSVPDPQPQSVETAYITIKNNSNTTLDEVLAGRAVWTRDPSGIAPEDNDKFRGKTKHDGRGEREQLLSEQFVDYGQYLMNMVAIPLMTPVKESNFKYVTTPDGLYGPATENFLKAYIDPEHDETLNNFVSGDRFAVKGVVSHHDNEQSLSEGESQHLDASIPYRSFRKLIQDYQVTVPASTAELGQQITQELEPTAAPGLSYTSDAGFDVEIFKVLRSRIITPEVMRGQVYNPTEGRTIAADGEFTDEDLGLYELYLSYDWDGDGVSNLVEVENATEMTLEGGVVTSGHFNPLNSMDSDFAETIKGAQAAGFNEIGRIYPRTSTPYLPEGSGAGPGLIVNGTKHVHGMRMPTFAPGFYDLGITERNKDSYAIPVVVKIMEQAAREYAKYDADIYPLDVEPALHATSYADSHQGFRIGLNDASLAGGGMVKAPGTVYGVYKEGNYDINLAERSTTDGLNTKFKLSHSTHQNGLDIDIRFLTKRESVGGIEKRHEKPVNFSVDNPETTVDETGNGVDFGGDGYDATLMMLQKVNAAARANGYKVSKMFAWDDLGKFPTNLGYDSGGTERTVQRLCSAVVLTFNNAPIGDCQTDVEPHRHHIHLRFEPINGSAYGLAMEDQEATITIPAGELEKTVNYTFNVGDTLGRKALTYTLLHFYLYNADGSLASNDNNGTLSAAAPYGGKLYVNPTNNAGALIGQAPLNITCHRASESQQVIYITDHLKRANPKQDAIGTIKVTCVDADSN